MPTIPRSAAAVALLICLTGAALLDHVDAASCLPLPCQLNNGCDCAPNVTFHSTTDGQYYGTCTACADGWAGPTCSNPFADCANGGRLVRNNSGAKTCSCPAAWGGYECTQRRCINSISAQPSATNNSCAGFCKPGFNGVQCQQCSVDSACQTGFACDMSLLPSNDASLAASKNLQCDVLSSGILSLLGDGRNVGGQASISCAFPAQGSGASPNLNPSRAAECNLQFYRVEEGGVWIDAFFFCALTNCTTTQHVAPGIKPAWASIPSAGSTSRRGARAVLLVCAFVLAAVHVALPAPSPAKLIIFKVTTYILVGTLILAVLVFGFDLNPMTWGVTQRIMGWNASLTGAEAKILYDCSASACSCAPTPTSGPGTKYSPTCVGSLFGERILPNLIHGATIDCDAQTGACEFNQRDLNTPIDLACHSGDCVNATQLGANSGIVPGATVASTAPDDTSRHTTIEALAWFGGFSLVTVLVMHYYYCKSRFNKAAVKFKATYLRTDDVDADLHNEPIDAARADADDAEGTSLATAANHTAAARSTDGSPQDEDATEEWELEVQDLCYFVQRNWAASSSAGHGSATAETALHANDTHANEHLAGSGDHRDRALRQRPARGHFLSNLIRSWRGGSKTVLDHVSFTAKPGECLALMGASGAGKTSLLDLLAARDKSGRVSGCISVAGETCLYADASKPIPAKQGDAGIVGTIMAHMTTTITPWLPGGKAWRRRNTSSRGRGSSSGDHSGHRHRRSAADPDRPDAPRAASSNSSFTSAGSTEAIVPVPASPHVDDEIDLSHPELHTRTAAEVLAIAQRVQRYKSLVGYVAQEDTLLPTLTVRQTFRLAAELRLPGGLSSETISEIVRQAIDALGLKRCADTVVGGIGGLRGLSGGERRRVSIGVELVGLPRVLFLDEPTSGLDSENARKVIECIAALARGIPPPPDDDDDDDGGEDHEAESSDADDFFLRRVRQHENPDEEESPDHGPVSERRGAATPPAGPPAPFSPEALRPFLGSWVHQRPIVIFSIHQPSRDMCRLFDKVLLVDRGRVLYHGPADSAMETLRAQVVEIDRVYEERLQSPRAGLGRGGNSDDALERRRSGDGSIVLDYASVSAADALGTTDQIHRRAVRQRLLRKKFHNPAEFLLALSGHLDPRDTDIISHSLLEGELQRRRR
jgi:ABC-type multidrug transport system ATPase subunit